MFILALSSVLLFALDAYSQVQVPVGYSTDELISTNRPIGLGFDQNGDLIVANVQTPPRTLTRVNLSNGQATSSSVVITFNGNDHRPEFIAIDPSDNIYFGRPDENDGDLYRLEPNNNIQTIYTAGSQELYDPRGLAFNAAGDLFVLNNVYPDGPGYISKFEFNSNGDVSNADIQLINLEPGNAMGLAFAPNGDLFVANDDQILWVKFDANGQVQSVNTNFITMPGGSVSSRFLAGVAIDHDGDMFVSQLYTNNADSGKIYQFDTLGNLSVFATGFNQPRNLIFDNDNRLFVADFLESKIHVIECADDPPAGVETFCAVDSSGTSINELILTEPYRVWPIPSRGSLTVHAPHPLAAIKLLNTTGQVVNAWSLKEGGNEMQLNLGELATGLYYLHITEPESGRTTALKVVLE